jgi:hypothetical protein
MEENGVEAPAKTECPKNLCREQKSETRHFCACSPWPIVFFIDRMVSNCLLVFGRKDTKI